MVPVPEMKSMSVLVLTPWYKTDYHPFEGLFITQQVEAFLRAGMHPVVVSPRPRWLPIPGRNREYWQQSRGLPESEERGGVTVYYPRYRRLPLGFGLRTVGKVCATEMSPLLSALHSRHRFKIVHGHEIIPAGFSAPFVRRALGIPFVLTVHGPNTVLADKLNTPPFKEARTGMWEAVDRIVAVGSSLLPYLAHLGCPPGRVSVVFNGFEGGSVHGLANVGPASPGGNELTVLSVANLYSSKGLEENVRALGRLTRMSDIKFRYVVVGEGPERSGLEAAAARLGVADRVTFTGRIDRQSTLDWMRRCDIFSLPSRREAFGIVYLEAMSAGKPVIGCRGQGAADIITDGVDGFLIEPGDDAGLAERWVQLATDPLLRESLGRAARAKAAEFTWERNVAAYSGIFAGLVES
jgi:teichuronic acid biosynthesis glycosyltransferase TuaC